MQKNPKPLITALAFLLLSVNTFSQHATRASFVFLAAKNNEDKVANQLYDSLKVWINHIPLLNKDKVYSIPINKNDFDTIVIKSSRPDKLDTILTKLKADERYTVNMNPCSLYEIGPTKRELKTRLVRVIVYHSNRRKLYLQSGVFFADLDTLQKRDTTFYYFVHPSSYCLFSTNFTSLCATAPDDNAGSYKCPRVAIQFMDAEKYTLLYDEPSGKMMIKFDGYYNKKEGIHIVE